MFSDPRTIAQMLVFALLIMAGFHLFILPVLIIIFGDRVPINFPAKNYLIILFIVSLGISVIHKNNSIEASKEKKLEKERKELACKASNKCQNDKAKWNSKFSDSVVASTTGLKFYKGSRCSSNCSGHIAGYNWAKKRGITKEFGCNGKSNSFTKGCLLYIDDFYLENEYQ